LLAGSAVAIFVFFLRDAKDIIQETRGEETEDEDWD
jgi:hypothetical protein